MTAHRRTVTNGLTSSLARRDVDAKSPRGRARHLERTFQCTRPAFLPWLCSCAVAPPFVSKKKTRPQPWEREVPFKRGLERDLRPGERPRPGRLCIVSRARRAKVASSNRGKRARAAVRASMASLQAQRRQAWAVLEVSGSAALRN